MNNIGSGLCRKHDEKNESSDHMVYYVQKSRRGNQMSADYCQMHTNYGVCGNCSVFIDDDRNCHRCATRSDVQEEGA